MPVNVRRTFGAVVGTRIFLSLAETAANRLFPPAEDPEPLPSVPARPRLSEFPRRPGESAIERSIRFNAANNAYLRAKGRRDAVEAQRRLRERQRRTTVLGAIDRIGGRIAGQLFASFGLHLLTDLSRQEVKALSLGDVIRLVVRNRYARAAAYASAIAAANKTRRVPSVEAVSYRVQYLIGERWLNAAKRLCPRESGRLAQSLRLEMTPLRGGGGQNYDMAIVSDVPYFEGVNADTGLVLNAWQSIRRDIPRIQEAELRRAGLGGGLRRRININAPDLVRTPRNRRVGRPQRVFRRPVLRRDTEISEAS